MLTAMFADFAILTSTDELILIELERPSMPLLKKDGGQAAELTHAVDQARRWLHQADEHRLAFLDGLKLEKQQVGKISAVVIAGRSAHHDLEHLRQLKGSYSDRITLLTYDDLLSSLDALRERFRGR